MALDGETGEIFFSEKQGGRCVENAKIYGDRIYFTNQSLTYKTRGFLAQGRVKLIYLHPSSPA
ncbi:MAG TPA: hypothetical protein ENK85_12575 [Saprospiraceae bacterium]|nr:hypothetical protein [Saprospiraceae bacterium]